MIKTKSYALGGTTSDWLAWELDGNHRPSRENVVIATNQALNDGMVVSVNEQHQVQAYTAVENEIPVGIYIGEAITTTKSDVGNGVIAARDTRIVLEKLNFKTPLTDEQTTTMLGHLAQANITTVRSV